jgi:hypothetical protein
MAVTRHLKSSKQIGQRSVPSIATASWQGVIKELNEAASDVSYQT